MADVLSSDFEGTISLGFGVLVTLPGAEGEHPFTDPEVLTEWCREAMMDGFDVGFSLVTSAAFLRANPGAPFEAWVGPRAHRWALDGRPFPDSADERGVYGHKGLEKRFKKVADDPYRAELLQGRTDQKPEFFVTLSDGVPGANVVFGHAVDRGWTGDLAERVEIFDQHPVLPWVVGVHVEGVSERSHVLDFPKKRLRGVRRRVKASGAALGMSERGRLRVLPGPPRS